MSYLDLNVKIDVTCPGCSHVSKVILKNLKGAKSYQCNGCNQQVTFEGDAIADGLNDTEKAISKMAKKFK